MAEFELKRLFTGDRFILQHVYLKSDGQSGDLDSRILIDPANENMGGLNKFVIDKVWWSFNGFSANIHYELLVEDTPIWVFPPSSGNHMDFTDISGLYDTGNDLDATGKMLLTTTGFMDLGDEGSMIIKMRKHR